MGGQIDRARGRVKEATGVLTGNKDLQRRGKAEQLAAEATLNIDKGASQARKAVDSGASEAEKLLRQGRFEAKQAIDKSRNALHSFLKN